MMSILSKTAKSMRQVSSVVRNLSPCNTLAAFNSAIKADLLQKNSFLNNLRTFSISPVIRSEEDEDESPKKKEKPIDPAKDRRTPIAPEVSIRYMNSKAYYTTYGEDPVFKKYRRNFKGQYQPKLTRKTCIKEGFIVSGNPCPICRDEYLVLDYTNIKLLKQFISPQTGLVYDPMKTGLCRRKQFDLEVAIEKAKQYGYITYQVPFREYNYSEFYKNLKNTSSSS